MAEVGGALGMAHAAFGQGYTLDDLYINDKADDGSKITQ